MRILLAPDKFRGSFTAREVCRHLSEGIVRVSPDISVVSLPLADGGEGTLDVLLGHLGGRTVAVDATGPMGKRIGGACYGIAADGRVILESARFCGLDPVPSDRRSPMEATSRGLGEAILDAMDAGGRDFLIGLGGTATVDGGSGMAEALGYRILWDDAQRTVCSGIDDRGLDPRLAAARFTALCDVDNPLLGPDGAAPVFAPQKGASPDEVLLLEKRLESLTRQAARWPGAGEAPGSGAGGGLGWGARVFLGAELTGGARTVMRLAGFGAGLAASDLVVTGEGAFDTQSLRGKVAGAVIEAAAVNGKPAAVVAGRWDGTLPGPACSPRALRIFAGSGPGPLGARDLRRLGEAASRWGCDTIGHATT